MRNARLLPAVAVCLTISLLGVTPFGAGPVLAAALDPAPEPATERSAAAGPVEATRWMIATANPLASEAGLAMLRKGGSAVDAAIAAQMVLNLVEPQSSGIGGGAFLVNYDRRTAAVTTYDGREKAPAAAKPDRFLKPDGEPMGFMDAVVGGRSVGVPGTLALLAHVHAKHGRLSWKTLMGPAMILAFDGFPISPRLHALLEADKHLRDDAEARAYFFQPDGTPWPVGHVLRAPALLRVLADIAAHGADALYAGPVARDIVAKVRSHPTNPGDMTLADLAAYEVVEREPVCGPYREYELCGMGPPSSGAVTIQQMLGLLEGVDMAALEPEGAEAIHWFSEAGRLAYADRGRYLADTDFIKVPVRGLIDPTYLADRARLMASDRSMGEATPGDPPWREAAFHGYDDGIEHGTSHISVVDGDGNAVSMTTTIESGFGARMMVHGFLLNNELTDFSFRPVDGAGNPIANRVEPGKRPRSSMAPTLVFGPKGELVGVVGSPGGSAIINYVAKTLVALIDWRLDPQAAVALPNMGSRNGPTELEAGTAVEAKAPALEALGHKTRVMDMTSGTQAIWIADGVLSGGADPRREGVALGD